jgi:aspartyl protease family protein
LNGGEAALGFLYAIMLLVLVASAFSVRRVPMGTGLKMLAGWGLIFAAAFVAFALKDDFKALGRRVMQEVSGDAGLVQAGGELRIRKADDGHFWVKARVNGESVDFLVDSGATTTVISAGAARRAGVEPSSRFRALVQTANGTVSTARGRANIKVGTIEREDLAVYIWDRDDFSVLGMNFLSSLSSWRVEGDWLILKA